ncbi:SDR family oxidoreductase [Nesterenkonia sp.]|uniref:SDR family NAD(P)-dependent oxidoreductase n=1 Tax=Nesterenkonia sp. TaxID=704201 RepID=UPI0026393FFD|nr:SDR family oxidoreductase [Nesterenkonia sp.]
MSSRTASHTALITGSTAGLGSAFARQLAAQGYDVVLAARSDDRLESQAETLTSRYGVRAEVIVADLTTDDGVGAVQERLADTAHPVHLLVNNAGHGLAGSFVDNELDAERDLLRLHVQTTMELTHTAARAMTAQRAGRIINVASVAGYTPTGTYSAAKAWVINFSKGLHSQLKPAGVTVTAVCPGLVRTEFHQRAGITAQGAKRWMWLEAEDVVRQALTANAQGAAVCVPSRTYQALTASLKFIPDSVVQWAADRGLGVPGQDEDAQRQLAAGSEDASDDGTAAADADSSETDSVSSARQ